MEVLDNPFPFPDKVCYHDSQTFLEIQLLSAFKFRHLRRQLNEDWQIDQHSREASKQRDNSMKLLFDLYDLPIDSQDIPSLSQIEIVCSLTQKEFDSSDLNLPVDIVV